MNLHKTHNRILMCNANLYKNTTNYFKVLKYMFFSTKKKKNIFPRLLSCHLLSTSLAPIYLNTLKLNIINVINPQGELVGSFMAAGREAGKAGGRRSHKK